MKYIGNRAKAPRVSAVALTRDRLSELFHYDPDTGLFTRLRRTAQRVRAGEVAGSPDSRGCLRMAIDGKLYLLHRLAWLYVTGVWPTNEIDHMDGNPSNNAFANLRDVPHLLNAQNTRRPRNAANLLGVSRSGSKYRADIRAEGKRLYLGTFATAEEAHVAFLNAKRTLHQGCTL